MNVNRILTGAALLALPALVLSHGGGLYANGGHDDRKNGGYHCHKSSVTIMGMMKVPFLNRFSTP
jgi:hypothetical protein